MNLRHQVSGSEFHIVQLSLVCVTDVNSHNTHTASPALMETVTQKDKDKDECKKQTNKKRLSNQIQFDQSI